MTPAASVPHVWPGDEGLWLCDAAYSCDNCHRMSVVSWVSAKNPITDANSREPTDPTISRWSPPAGEREEFPDVPTAISSAASEAFLCHSVGAHRAACALARAVVEATAKDRGCTSGSILQKIDKLYETGLIREAVRESAHEIRHLGNEVAHGDFAADSITVEDAEENLELLRELLNEVYQAPARTSRVRRAREKKRAGAP